MPTRPRLAVLLACVALFGALLSSSDAHAYPWMIRHGFAKCGSCHTDPSGGETLTGFGRVMSDTTLSTRWDGGRDPTSVSQLLFGIPEPQWLRLGGSVRYMNIYNLEDSDFNTFPMQADVYGQLRFGDVRLGGSLGAARVPADSPHAKAAQITSGNEDDDFNLISRNHWVGYDVTPSVLVRGGRMNLPFGMRIPEHVMWVREATRTDRESDQQHGLAINYSQGRWRGELMGIVGNFQISPDDFRERGYALGLEYLFEPELGVGLSSLVTRAERDRFVTSDGAFVRQAHGLTARYSPVKPVVVLAEADALLSSETDLGYVGLLQVDYELVQGVHLMATGEALDRGQTDGSDSAPGGGEPVFGAWFSLNWFVYTHFDFRIDLLLRQEAPTTIQGQGHFYF